MGIRKILSSFRFGRISILAVVFTLFAVGALYVDVGAQGLSEEQIAARERELRAELDSVMADIARQQKILDQKQVEGKSIERDIAILNAQIAKAKLSIRAHTIAIDGLGKDINKKTQTIEELEAKIDKNKISLARLIVRTNEIDSYSLVEVALGNQTISTFFEDIDSFTSIKSSMRDAFNDLRSTKSATELEKDSLLRKRLEEVGKKISVEDEKKKIEIAEAEKKRLLSLSKQEQANYQLAIKDRERRAAEIRTALFSLRDTAAIPFGDALAYANSASKATGVRPAFILGILTQESNLGKNTGSCLLKDPKTGSGVGVNTDTPFEKVMHATRDVPPFLELMTQLGRDPYTTRVSCPQAIGFGGAMGPSQFIASTWKMYANRIAAAVGKPIADPWHPRDAITATAIFLADLGAGKGTAAAEQEAAARYYAGGNWQTAHALSYAASVARHASTIQTTMIDPLQGL